MGTSPENGAAISPVRHRAAPSSTNLSSADEHTTNPEIRQLFAHYRDRFGRPDLPGIVLCFATNPALLKGMMQIADGLLFGESLLNRRHKEMIATHVSLQNACPYCADSHGVMLGAQGGSAEMICALREGELNARFFTVAETALLKFAEKVNANAPAITRADVEGAMQAGWTESQVAETVHITALFAAFNRIANGFGLPSPYAEGV